jgi:hypothetical protein
MSPAVLVKLLTLSGLTAVMLSMGFKVKFEEVLDSIRQHWIAVIREHYSRWRNRNDEARGE